MRVLKQRVLTSVVLIPCVIGLVFFAPYPLFDSIAAVLMLLGAWEWSKLMGLKELPERLCYLVLMGILLRLAYLMEPEFASSELMLQIGCIWWGLMALILIYLVHQHRTWVMPAWIVGISGALILIPCWVALSVLRVIPYGSELLLLLLLFVWGADIGAYFAGRAWGHRKLAPLISPGKTWAGCYGGGIAIALIIGIYSLIENLSWTGIAAWLLLGLLILIVSVIGDLFESLLKRGRSIKDTGSLLPGHGGILDRIDSLLAAAPIFTLSILLFGEQLIV
jgi:phosphatidate cytidylyltransferase